MKKFGPKARDIAGNKYHKLTAIRFSHYGINKKPYWLFLCDCGKQIIRTKIGVTRKNNHIKSCGCAIKEFVLTKLSKFREVPSGTTAVRPIMAQYIENAVYRGVNFSLTVEKFEKLILSTCYYCGISGSNFFKQKGKIKGMFYNGIRILIVLHVAKIVIGQKEKRH